MTLAKDIEKNDWYLYDRHFNYAVNIDIFLQGKECKSNAYIL